MEWNADNIREKYGFDAVGIVKEEGKSIIILGLETRPDRDLDEFIGGVSWCYSGFEKHFSPRINEVLIDIEDADRDAKPIPGDANSIRLKEKAVKSGIGVQARNTLIVDNRFQSRLRFKAIETFLDIRPTGDGVYARALNPRCEECCLCELACPVGILQNYKLIEEEKCIAHRQLTHVTPGLVRCNLCWIACTKDYGWAQQMAREKDKIVGNFLP